MHASAAPLHESNRTLGSSPHPEVEIIRSVPSITAFRGSRASSYYARSYEANPAHSKPVVRGGCDGLAPKPRPERSELAKRERSGGSVSEAAERSRALARPPRAKIGRGERIRTSDPLGPEPR
jgi:hypothetical protein